MIHFDIPTEYINLVDESRLEKVIQAVLDFEKISEEVELSLVFGGDEQIRELNRDYLGHDSHTDVLSFPSDETDPDSGLHYIGDILLSCPRAEEQARATGHSAAAEIELLVIHAVLHLLGHDHAEPGEKENMWAAQTALLHQLGTPIQSMPE